VSLLEVVPALERTEAAAALGLDPNRPALLLGLGLGLPGDPVDARRAVIERALQHSAWQVGFIRSPLADRSQDPTSDPAQAENAANMVPIDSVYPLTRYLAAFDAAINAAGYNSVHELIPARVPTLFIPKLASRTDNQTARAAFLERRGLALMAPEGDLAAIERQVDNLLGDARAGLVERLDEVSEEELMGGAAAVADILTSDSPVGIRETGTEVWRQPGLKGMVKRLISPTGVRLLQQVLGRAPPDAPQGTENLDPAQGPNDVLVSDDMESVSLASRRPVEHVMEGASSAYRESRRDLNQEFYDVG
jgi:hypothetical protein